MTVCPPCRTAATAMYDAVLSLRVLQGGPVTEPTTKDLVGTSMEALYARARHGFSLSLANPTLRIRFEGYRIT